MKRFIVCFILSLIGLTMLMQPTAVAIEEDLDTIYMYNPFYYIFIDTTSDDTTRLQGTDIYSPYGLFKDSLASPIVRSDYGLFNDSIYSLYGLFQDSLKSDYMVTPFLKCTTTASTAAEFYSQGKAIYARGESYGIMAYADKEGTGASVGGYFGNPLPLVGSGTRYGIKANAKANKGNAYGGHFDAMSDSGVVWGIYTTPCSKLNKNVFGVYAQPGCSGGTGNEYGGYFQAQNYTNDPGISYGIYAKVLSEGVNDYSGYFEGKIYAGTSVETPKLIIGSYYLSSLLANNKVPDSDKLDGQHGIYYEVQLNDEAGLYVVLSDVTDFVQAAEADIITEGMLKAVDAAVDEDILTYESTTGDFEWHIPSELITAGDHISWTTMTLNVADDWFDTEGELTALLDDNYEGLLGNEAGLYAALSDVTDFTQPTEVPGMTSTKVKIVFAFNLYTVADDMDGIMLQFPRAITITKVTMKCKDGTNVIGRLYEVDGDGDPVDKVGVETGDWTVTTTETEDTSFNNATFDAGDYIWWETTSVSGTVTMFTVTVEGYET